MNGGTKRKQASPIAPPSKAQRLEKRKIAPQCVPRRIGMDPFVTAFCEQFRRPEDALGWLLSHAEMSVDEFIQTTWQKFPLVVPTKDSEAQTSKLKLLFGYDFMVKTTEVRSHDKNRMEKLFYHVDFYVSKTVDDKFVELEQRLVECRADHMTVEQLRSVLADGYSAQLANLARFQRGFHAFGEPLETFLGCLVRINGYVSPPGGQMRPLRYDNEDYFVIQTEGSETWKLYKAQVELPIRFSETLSRAKVGDPIMTVTLKAGDVLYVPRGTIFESRASADTRSAYVILSSYCNHYVGLFVKHTLDLIIERLESECVDLRRGLPVGYHNLPSSKKKEVYADALVKLAEAIRSMDELSDEEKQPSLDFMVGQFMTNRLPPFNVERVYGDANYTMKTKVELRNKQHFAYYTRVAHEYSHKNADEELGDGTDEEDEETDIDPDEIVMLDDDDEEAKADDATKSPESAKSSTSVEGAAGLVTPPQPKQQPEKHSAADCSLNTATSYDSTWSEDGRTEVAFMSSIYNDVIERQDFFENRREDKMISYDIEYRPILDRLMAATDPLTIEELSEGLDSGVNPINLITVLENLGAVKIT